MPIEQAEIAGFGNAWEAIGALVAADGADSHSLPRRLSVGVAPMRDLADIVHHFGILHGRHPCIADLAATHPTAPAAAPWLDRVVEQFAEERSFLVHLVAAVGPLPSTPGQAETEAAVVGQRHALDMLGQSDRAGCAIGASVALVLDWPRIRTLLDSTAERVGVNPPRLDLPERYETATVVSALATDQPVERAMLFGAQQMLAQHRGLWDLLEARAGARHHD